MALRVLSEYLLELVADDEAPLTDPRVTREEADAGAKVMAGGGIEGALAAINATIGAHGYQLRRVHGQTGARPPVGWEG